MSLYAKKWDIRRSRDATPLGKLQRLHWLFKDFIDFKALPQYLGFSTSNYSHGSAQFLSGGLPYAWHRWTKYNTPHYWNESMDKITDDTLALQPLTGNLTFQKLAAYISGAILVFSALIALIITVMHATQFSDPRRQRQ
jgi:hypothetical protein